MASGRIHYYIKCAYVNNLNSNCMLCKKKRILTYT